MSLVVYLDETGDHSLDSIDKDFPVFVLTMFVVDEDEYISRIVPAVNRLKFDYFGHEGVILHSRDIRKAQNDFRFLQLTDRRQPFYERINEVMRDRRYQVIAVAIRKNEHKQRYGASSEDPYELSLEYGIERLLPLLERAGQRDVVVIAEARGRKEDDALRLSFLQLTAVPFFKIFNWRLVFVPKTMNIVGHQLADLIGYPIARKVLDSTKENPAFDIIREKLADGFKVFP